MYIKRGAWLAGHRAIRQVRTALFRFGLALGATQTAAQAQAVTPGEAAIQIDRAMRAAEAQGFGGAVIVVHRGTIIIRRGYGFADRERRTRFTPATIAQIGSITKTFTGLAVAQLIAAGRIDPDATVGTYLPDAPEPGRSLVINDILTHRSGLMDACAEDFDNLSAERLVTYCLAQPLEHARGENHYSNMGYSVIARIVEAVTGQSWEIYLRRNVWMPLGMRSTGFRFRTPPRGVSFANGYLENVKQPIISTSIARLSGNDWALRGNGGMQASADDMIRFFRTVLEGPEIAPAVRAVMLAPHGPSSENVREGYGLFFRRTEQGGLWRIGHAGSDGVFLSYLGWYPRSRTLLYFVGNNGETPVREALRPVLQQVGNLPPD